MKPSSVSFSQRTRPALTRLIAAVLAFAATGLAPARAAETVLYSFKGGIDGASPNAGLIFDTPGALYGTTMSGGASNLGTVFKLTPPAPGQTQWTHTVLYSFKGLGNGSYPRAGLIFNTNGALYGTTAAGGLSSSHAGTVFKLTPPVQGQTQWTHTVLYRFKGGSSDGANPRSSLIFDTSGGLYGTTLAGGTSGSGTVFKLTPPAPGQTQWTESVLYSFPAGSNPPTGANGGVIFRVVFGQKGELYGTIFDGVFKLTPPASGQGPWTQTLLHSFRTPGGTVVANPGLILDTNGAIYGTTSWGAAKVYKLTPPAAGQTQWTETVLHSFKGGTPVSRLVFNTRGALFGTTYQGGASNAGTVFEVVPPVPGQTQWTPYVLYSFKGGSDGANPETGLIFDTSGSLYGTTSKGGTANAGTVFRFK